MGRLSVVFLESGSARFRCRTSCRLCRILLFVEATVCLPLVNDPSKEGERAWQTALGLNKILCQFYGPKWTSNNSYPTWRSLSGLKNGRSPSTHPLAPFSDTILYRSGIFWDLEGCGYCCASPEMRSARAKWMLLLARDGKRG
jgi:hypothetical protein